MPLARLRFEVEGEVAYSRAFEAYERELRDMSEPLAEIGGLIIESVGEQFLTEGAHGGSRWEPLDPSYARFKQNHAPAGEGAPLLVFSGEMRGKALDRGSALTVTADRVVYEPDSDLAGYHHKGKGDLPARRIVNLTAADRREWDREIIDWLTSIRRGAIR